MALESTYDPGYREKIGAMIGKGVFSSCQALIMGEFSSALLGEFGDAMQDTKLGGSTKEERIKIMVDKMGIIESQREVLCESLSQNYDILFGPDRTASYQFQISLLPMLKQSLFAGIAADLESAGCHMPIYKEEAGQSAVFGHGCRRGAYISSSTCIIASDGAFTSLNPIAKAVAMKTPSAAVETPRAVDQLAAESPEVVISR